MLRRHLHIPGIWLHFLITSLPFSLLSACSSFMSPRCLRLSPLLSPTRLSVCHLPFLKQRPGPGGADPHYCHGCRLLTASAIVILFDPALSKSPVSFPLCLALAKIPTTTTTTSTTPSHALMLHRLSPQIPLIIIPETSVPSCLSTSLVASKGPDCLCSFSFIKTSCKIPAYA